MQPSVTEQPGELVGDAPPPEESNQLGLHPGQCGSAGYLINDNHHHGSQLGGDHVDNDHLRGNIDHPTQPGAIPASALRWQLAREKLEIH